MLDDDDNYPNNMISIPIRLVFIKDMEEEKLAQMLTIVGRKFDSNKHIHSKLKSDEFLSDCDIGRFIETYPELFI